MSLDRTLKSTAALTRLRNVLTRAERVSKLMDEERWESGTSVFGLPKIAVVHRSHKSKSKSEDAAKAAEEGADQAENGSGDSKESAGKKT